MLQPSSKTQLPDQPLIGMVHLAPLPGTPGSRQTLREIIALAIADAQVLEKCGFDGIMIENFGDVPFRAVRVDPHTIAAMTVVARAVREATKLPIGINMLRNDPLSAMAVASCCEAAFIRVNIHTGVYATDQGMIEGRADETLRYREQINAALAIYADVHVKHARPLSNLEIAEAAEETAYRGRADGLIVSGTATGKPADLDDLRRVRKAVPDRTLLVGSGAHEHSIREIMTIGAGAIVGTSIKVDRATTAAVDPNRARAFIAAARS